MDTQVVPLGVNIAGGAEVALDRAAARLGVRPSAVLVGVAGLLSLGLFAVLRQRRDTVA